jgi:hypothetical protein
MKPLDVLGDAGLITRTKRGRTVDVRLSARPLRGVQGSRAGALTYMLSKRGCLGDDAAGPWLPHLMFFVPHGQAAAWGAGAEGSPIIGRDGSDIESTTLLVPVRRWSDGSPAPPPAPLDGHAKK